MENVVAAIFDVESEGLQALSEIRQKPAGENYFVAEAALLKMEEGQVKTLDGFDTGAATSDDTAKGIIVGSLVGIIGGPLGVLLGASTGALIGSSVDSADILDSSSMIEVVAKKLYEDEVAVVALVKEEEPAFDVVFEKFKATIIRFDAIDVLDEVDRAREVELELERAALQKMREERAAERKVRIEERAAALSARIDEISENYDPAMNELYKG